MTLAELMRSAREAKGWSQEATAQRSGLSSSTVIRVEGGKLMPLAPTLFALADALGIDYQALRDAVRTEAPDPEVAELAARVQGEYEAAGAAP